MSEPPATPSSSPQEYGEPGRPTAGTGPSGPRAGFGKRFVAALLDSVVLYVVLALLVAITNRATGQSLQFFLAIAYYIYLEGSPSGQTIGKKVLNIRVISFSTGGQLGYGSAAIRYFARFLSALPLLLGYFWMLWDREKQTWHDKLSTSVVVPTADYPVEKWPG